MATSRFPFQLPFPYCSTKTIPDHDDDGDIVVERKQQYVFVIGMFPVMSHVIIVMSHDLSRACHGYSTR